MSRKNGRGGNGDKVSMELEVQGTSRPLGHVKNFEFSPLKAIDFRASAAKCSVRFLLKINYSAEMAGR